MKQEDRYNLVRFLTAQENWYDRALSEMINGKKVSHWMWYIFPQLRELGHSSTSKYYGITELEEAKEYLSHPVLGKRLMVICETVLAIKGKTATEIFGKPDDMKFRSSLTLFAKASNKSDIFDKLLEKFYDGKEDVRTLKLLERNGQYNTL